MSKVKDFILQRKAAAFKKSVQEGKIPEQGSYVTLYNNNYKVLTKPDSKIVILEDNRSNKIAYDRNALSKMLNESGEAVEKADAYGKKPTNLVGHIGQNVKPGSNKAPTAAGGAAPAKPVDPVGTVRNGRKKIVSKKTGQTMWVNIATGEGHAEHNSQEPQDHSPEATQEAKDFMSHVSDNLHPGDKLKLQKQMKDLISLKQKAMNMLEMAHQEDRSKSPEVQLTRNKVFRMQDEYKKAFKQFAEDAKASAIKLKKETGNEA